MKFEDVLAEVGSFGRFQLMTIFLMVIPRLTLALHFLLNNFIAVIPSHHCNISSLDDGGIFRNLSQAERLVVGLPVQKDGTPNSCQMFAEPQYHLLRNSSSMAELPTVPCQNGWVYDNTTFNGIWFAIKEELTKPPPLSSSWVLCLELQYLAILVTGIEWVDIKHRTAVGILISMDWTVSTVLLVLLAYFVNDWRYLTATATAPLLLAIVTWWWVPESARWLISNRKVNSAHFYLSKCAKINGREQVMADLKPEVLSKAVPIDNQSKKYSYLDLVKTPEMRRLTLLTGVLWFGVSCVYYGISLNVAGFGVNIYLTQFIFGMIEIPAKTFIFFTLQKLSRRLNQAGTLGLTGLCLFCNMFVPRDMTLYRTTVGTLGKMSAEGAFTIVVLYTSELYPTVMRQSGLGYSSFVALIGVSLSPLIMVLEDVWLYLPSTVFTFLAFAAALSACLLSETQNVNLPETIEDVEQTRGRLV
ncbi:solute carrier family 22 member 7-like [Plectropomus leopardus]|uniref:solute carrier family 22 member 7-like n=1 Tax=Plectropomus leopardus TaxID=160734 RepID=UPI001C4D3E48|nr:solute carrier family 22 member 7-like [Plectropomus leopardus]